MSVNCSTTVPDQHQNDLPTTSTKTRKRSSKAVRERKKMSRRVVLNKFSVERIQKALKINVVEIDGEDVDFTDAFAFFTWYLDNYAKFDDEIPKEMVLKFREHYLSFNLDEEGKQFLIDNIRHKQLFEDCGYEKIENSDSDESVYNIQHKSDSLSMTPPPQMIVNPCPSPTYQPMSPVYCPSTDGSESSRDHEKTPPVVNQVEKTPPVVNQVEEPMECDPLPPPVENIVEKGPKVLYHDYGAHVLMRIMTQQDFDDIDARKKSLITSRRGNVKIRYFGLTLCLRVDSIWDFCPRKVEPLVSTSLCAWDRKYHMGGLEIAVKPGSGHISHVVRMD